MCDTEALLPYTCRYENSRGESIALDGAPIVVRDSELFDYGWKLTASDAAAGDGGRAVAARRAVQDRTLMLDVFADTQEAHNAALNRLHDVMDYDVEMLTPGKLWVNGQYIRCFAYASEKTLDRDWTRYTVVKLTLKVVSPAWTAEETVTVLPAEPSEQGGAYKQYDGKYPYRYTEESASYRFVNRSGGRVPMILKIFGPCHAPSVFVGGCEYGLTGDVAQGAYAVIDQRDKSIVLVGADGTKSNYFAARKKSVDNFLGAPTGNLQITCSGAFACEVTFLTRRSEPKWI